MKIRICAALALTAGLSSCMSWGDQEVIIKTEPALADCTVVREGIPIARLAPTPGAVYIPMSNAPITITCSKPGYRTASVSSDSDLYGNSYFEYDSPITVTLEKQEEEAAR